MTPHQVSSDGMDASYGCRAATNPPPLRLHKVSLITRSVHQGDVAAGVRDVEKRKVADFWGMSLKER